MKYVQLLTHSYDVLKKLRNLSVHVISLIRVVKEHIVLLFFALEASKSNTIKYFLKFYNDHATLRYVAQKWRVSV